MSVPVFGYTEIKVGDVNSWPESPDRKSQGVGRGAYSDKAIQQAFNNSPAKSVLLSTMSNLLKECEPFNLEKAVLYKKDPVIKLLQSLSSVNSYLTDDSFPPSVWQGKSVISHKRISELSQSPVIYKSAPSVIDMSQRGLGDCGFVSTVGATSLHPQGHNIIFSSIYPCVYNPLGFYSVRIISGTNVGYIIVDDLLPQAGYSVMLDKDVFWYLIIEKAISKLKAGYQNLGGGCEAYFGLKSSANTAISKSNMDSVWKSKFIPIFQEGQSDTYQGTQNGTTYLHTQHAYAIIDAQSWGDIKLVRLHNPWNYKDSYSGPYCPDSKDWDNIPTDIQESVFQNSRFDGRTFWMPYDLYMNDLPKISDLSLASSLPDVLKSIANVNTIQGDKSL